MDPHAFDRLSRTLFTAGSRRAALSALAAAGAALGLAGGQRASAQPTCTVNGDQCCIDNGDPCRSGEECCSGRCKRRHNGRKACRQAGNQGLCTVDDDHCTDSAIICGTASDSGDCFCFVTTAGRSFCGNTSEIQPGNCGCASSKQCQRRLGEGARCVRVGDLCEDSCPSGATSGCMAPCPDLNPPA